MVTAVAGGTDERKEGKEGTNGVSVDLDGNGFARLIKEVAHFSNGKGDLAVVGVGKRLEGDPLEILRFEKSSDNH